MKQVLLVSPAAGYFHRRERMYLMEPMGLLYLAAVLRAHHRVSVLEAETHQVTHEGLQFVRHGMRPAEIRERIRVAAPDIVGVSFKHSTQAAYGYEVVRLAKQVSPNIVTVVGGPHVSFEPEEALAVPEVDFVVLGEGEQTLVELCNWLDGPRHRSPDGIQGIAFRRDGLIHKTPPREPLADLNSLPFPARDLLNPEQYFGLGRAEGPNRRRRHSTVLTSRGCPHSCSMCSSRSYWKDFRRRSVENVLAEIEELVAKYGIEEIHFRDDNLLCDRSFALELFSRLAGRRLNLIWGAPNGLPPWELDREMIDTMRASGCYYISLPVEAASQRVRQQIINKPGSQDKLGQVVQDLKRAGIDVYGCLMIGFPGEQRHEIEASVQLARRLKLKSFRFFIATPLPGTRLRELALANGDLEDERSNSPALRYCRGVVRTSEFRPADVQAIRHRGWLETTYLDRGLYKEYLFARFIQPALHLGFDALALARQRLADGLSLHFMDATLRRGRQAPGQPTQDRDDGSTSGPCSWSSGKPSHQ